MPVRSNRGSDGEQHCRWRIGLGVTDTGERFGLCAGNGEIPIAEVYNAKESFDDVITVAPVARREGVRQD